MNVSVFAIVLIDQIIERVSFEKAKTIASESPSPSPPPAPLLEQVLLLLEQFVGQFKEAHEDKLGRREAEIFGALSGFLSATVPELLTASKSDIDHPVNRPDFYLESKENGERLILEVKLRGSSSGAGAVDEGTINRVVTYMESMGISQAIIFVYLSQNSGRFVSNERNIGRKKIIIASAE